MATFPVKERFDNLYNYPLGEEPPSASPVTEVTNVSKKIDPVTGSIITGAISAGANLIMNYSNNRANDRRQQEAYEQNLRMWHMQNEYNSPASQIARLKAAGLNPNLLYGSPDNTAQAPPAKGVSEGKAGQIDPMIAMNAMSIAKQMEVSDAEIRLKDAEARNFDADTNLKNEDYDWKPTQRQQESESHFVGVQQVLKTIDNLDSIINFRDNYETRESSARAYSREIENKLFDATFDYRVESYLLKNDYTKSEIDKAKAIIADFYSQIAYRKKQGELIDERILTEQMQRCLMHADIDVKNKYADKLEVETIIGMGKKEFNYGLLWEKYFRGTLTEDERNTLFLLNDATNRDRLEGNRSTVMALLRLLFSYSQYSILD